MLMERSMVDFTSGWALVKEIPYEARNLITTITANSQQFDTHNNRQGKVNELSTNLHLKQQLINLTILVQ